jgi:hypothetical protein
VGLLGPCGAFTESSRPLTFPLSPAGTPESKSFSLDVLTITGMSTLLPTETRVELTCWSKDPASPRRFPNKTGISPRTPSVVFRTLELSPEDDMLREFFKTLATHPYRFAFYPSAPVRQAVLRTSSRLAPSFVTVRPCERPVKKTRDASNQLLPPIRTTCTRTSRVPDSLRWLPSADVPRRLRLRTTRSGDRVFHDTRRPLRRIVPAC